MYVRVIGNECRAVSVIIDNDSGGKNNWQLLILSALLQNYLVIYFYFNRNIYKYRSWLNLIAIRFVK